METIKIGAKVKISPNLTGENGWLEGIVKNVEENPFNGTVVYAQALKNNIIYFNKLRYFELI